MILCIAERKSRSLHIGVGTLALCAFLASPTMAAERAAERAVEKEGDAPRQAGAIVVPAHEHGTAVAKVLDGPTESKGIAAVRQLGSAALERDFPILQGRVLRARELEIAPGGVVAAHTHQQRPGVAYILSGEILEHRSDQAEPILRQQGDVAFEYSGVSHWWQNVSDQPVRALVVDVFDQASPK